MIDEERFAALRAAYGGDLRRWPQAERAQARARLDGDAVATLALATDRALDEALDAWRPPPPSHALRTAVLASAARRGRGWSGAWRRRAAAWVSGAGLATAAISGVLVGATLVPPASRDGELEASTASIYADPAGPLAGPSDGGFT